MEFTGNPAGLPQLAFTHAGRFHADDVLSAALLQLLRPDIRIHRGFTVPKGFSGIVFDIGGGPFDHHEKNSPVRPNGVPYAAFGLLWREYGHHFLAGEQATWFDEKFVQPLDLDDNKGTGNLLATLLGCFNPQWDEDRPEDEAFFEAVEVARKILMHRLDNVASIERGRKAVSQALAQAQDRVVVLERYIPWKPVLVPGEADFVVFPSPRGGYSLQCVPRDYAGKTGNKVPLPQAWHGAPAEKLQALTGVPDISFCHASGFMCSVGSVQGALKLAALAQQAEQERRAKRAAEKAQRDEREGATRPRPEGPSSAPAERSEREGATRPRPEGPSSAPAEHSKERAGAATESGEAQADTGPAAPANGDA